MFKRYWWMLLVMMPVGMMAGFLVASVVTYMMPKQYESSAVIEIKSRTATLLAPNAREVSTTTSIGCGAPFDKIKSRNSFLKVIEKLDLKKRWSMTEYASLQVLKRIVRTENLRGTDLISVTVRHSSREDARDIAAEVVHAYIQYRGEVEWRASEKVINKLKKAMREQEEEVDLRRKIIISYATKIHHPNVINHEIISADDAEILQLKSIIRSLEKYEDEQLLIYASGVEDPDNVINRIYPEYLTLKRKIEGLKAGGIADGDASLDSKSKSLDGLKLRLDQGVESLRARLDERLRIAEARLQEGNAKTPEPMRRHLKIDPHAYTDAKRDFAAAQALLEQMKLSLIEAELNQNSSTIIIHEDPVIADSPVSPNVTKNLFAGVAGGLLFSPFMAFPLMWMMNRRNCRNGLSETSVSV